MLFFSSDWWHRCNNLQKFFWTSGEQLWDTSQLHTKLLSSERSVINGSSDCESDTSYHGVFIRAPAVVSVDSPKVEVLATIDWPEREEPVVVGVAQDNLMATAFHPELTEDTRWHAYFLRKILGKGNVEEKEGNWDMTSTCQMVIISLHLPN